MDKKQMLEMIGRHASDVLPDLDEHVFLETDRLTDLGANSVDRAEIAMLVQEELRLCVPRIELIGPSNVGELADLFLRKLAAAVTA